MKVRKIDDCWMVILNKFFYPKEYVIAAYNDFLNDFKLEIVERGDELLLKISGKRISETDVYEFLNNILVKIKEVI